METKIIETARFIEKAVLTYYGNFGIEEAIDADYELDTDKIFERIEELAIDEAFEMEVSDDEKEEFVEKVIYNFCDSVFEELEDMAVEVKEAAAENYNEFDQRDFI